jgi:hypothetical protein
LLGARKQTIRVQRTLTGIHTNCPYPHSETASTTLHSPTPRYLNASQSSTGSARPYAYTNDIAMLNSLKS